jgi:hypothetical protein
VDLRRSRTVRQVLTVLPGFTRRSTPVTLQVPSRHRTVPIDGLGLTQT